MSHYRIGDFVGSLAKASINRRLAQALIRLAPPDLEFTEIPIKDLPLCEAYLQYKPDMVADDGTVGDEKTREFLRAYMSEFREFIERVLTVLPRAA